VPRAMECRRSRKMDKTGNRTPQYRAYRPGTQESHKVTVGKVCQLR
jgi:hypothetical protein